MNEKRKLRVAAASLGGALTTAAEVRARCVFT